MKENYKSIFRHCTLKTIAMSLVISFWLAVDLTCFLVWFSIVTFQAMSESPISYPTSIVGGLVSLVAFLLSVFFYVKMRQTNFSVKGVVMDALITFLSLPVLFFWLTQCVYPWLQRLV